jgi:short-subunit dehydrogenase
VFAQRYGRWAVIAGGSEGIGASFADRLAAQGLDLVLIARKPEPLERLADRLRATHGVQVRALSLDLAAADMAEQVAGATAGLEVGLLVYNAGASHVMEDFLDQPLEGPDASLHLIRLNVLGPVALCHHFGRAMRERRRGGIVVCGALAPSGARYVAAYGGAKGFSLNFTESLWAELRPYDVDVLQLLVGQTRTPAMERMGVAFAEGIDMSSDAVADEALANLANGPTWIPGAANRAAAEAFWKVGRRDMVEMLSDVTTTYRARLAAARADAS